MGQLRSLCSKQDIESGLFEMVVGREYVLNGVVKEGHFEPHFCSASPARRCDFPVFLGDGTESGNGGDCHRHNIAHVR
jgi:hypothetical protein